MEIRHDKSVRSNDEAGPLYPHLGVGSSNFMVTIAPSEALTIAGMSF